MPYTELNKLYQSNNDNDILIADQIAIGMGLNWLEIFKIKYNLMVTISVESAAKAGVTSSDGSDLLKCFKCEGEEFDSKVLETIQGRSCEESIICKNCGHSTYWGYGSLDLNGDYS